MATSLHLQSFVIDTSGTVQYLSEDGRLNVERGAEHGTAEEGKEGREKERHEHHRIPFLQSKNRKEEKGEGKKGPSHAQEVKNINMGKEKFTVWGVVRVIVRGRCWLLVVAEASIRCDFLTVLFPHFSQKRVPLCY